MHVHGLYGICVMFKISLVQEKICLIRFSLGFAWKRRLSKFVMKKCHFTGSRKQIFVAESTTLAVLCLFDNEYVSDLVVKVFKRLSVQSNWAIVINRSESDKDDWTLLPHRLLDFSVLLKRSLQFHPNTWFTKSYFRQNELGTASVSWKYCNFLTSLVCMHFI